MVEKGLIFIKHSAETTRVDNSHSKKIVSRDKEKALFSQKHTLRPTSKRETTIRKYCDIQNLFCLNPIGINLF